MNVCLRSRRYMFQTNLLILGEDVIVFKCICGGGGRFGWSYCQHTSCHAVSYQAVTCAGTCIMMNAITTSQTLVGCFLWRCWVLPATYRGQNVSLFNIFLAWNSRIMFDLSKTLEFRKNKYLVQPLPIFSNESYNGYWHLHWWWFQKHICKELTTHNQYLFKHNRTISNFNLKSTTISRHLEIFPEKKTMQGLFFNIYCYPTPIDVIW